MSELRDDPLADAVFRTPEGQATQVGLFTSAIVAIPALATWAIIQPNSDIKAEEYRIGRLQKQHDSLSDSAQVLEDRGFNDLANQLQDQAKTLTTEITLARDAIPPHLAGDVANVLLLSAPFVVGALAGFLAFKKLKKQNN